MTEVECCWKGRQTDAAGITSSCTPKAARCKSFSSRLPRGKMERAFTPRLVTDLPHSRLAAELSRQGQSNWQRPASLQNPNPSPQCLPDETSCSLGKIDWDSCGVQVPAKRQKRSMIHFLASGMRVQSVSWSVRDTCIQSVKTGLAGICTIRHSVCIIYHFHPSAQ